MEQKQNKISDNRDIFREKIQKAIKFHRRRTFFKNFAMTKFPELDFSQFNGNRSLRAKLYLDETGKAGVDDDFAIGGIYVVGPDDDKEWEKFFGPDEDNKLKNFVKKQRKKLKEMNKLKKMQPGNIVNNLVIVS